MKTLNNYYIKDDFSISPIKNTKDRIVIDINKDCDINLEYLLRSYLYKHIENFQSVIQADNEFKKHTIKTEIIEDNGKFDFVFSISKKTKEEKKINVY